jgi:cytochrome c oxidase cbb3-type subunit 3
VVIRLGALGVAAVLLLGQEGPPAGRPARGGRGSTRDFLGLGPAPDAAAADRGEKLYGPNCGFCHGAKANGAEGPDLVRSALVLHDEKAELIGPVIHNGRPDKGMPPFPGFTEAQLSDLAQFLHMRVELAVNRGLYKLQNVVTGNAKAGEAYFVGKCASCHSVTGDLAHIGSKFQPSDLQQAFLYPGARGFEPAGTKGGTKVTVTLASGEVVSGTLRRLDDFNVSLDDTAGEYHSYALGKGVKVDVADKLVKHRELLDHYTDAEMHNVTAYLATIK